jgi:hypothetical protein
MTEIRKPRKNVFTAIVVLIFSSSWFLGINIDHKKEAWKYYRWLAIPIPFMAFFCSLNWVYSIALSTAILGFLWILLFDGFYNLRRSKKFFFVNRVDYPQKSIADRFWSLMPTWAMIAIKVTGVISTLTLYILKFKGL